MNQINQQVALVTGSSRGVGASVAKLLSESRVKVCVNYFQNEKKANSVVNEILSKGGEAFPFKADVTNLPEVESMIHEIENKYGRLDFIINKRPP
jgi:3-oxoacyl-[acyl-carrier protein] reductase